MELGSVVRAANLIAQLTNDEVILSRPIARGTRFYIHNAQTPPVSPTFDSGWERTTEAVRRTGIRDRILTNATVQVNEPNTITTAGQDILAVQQVIGPLAAQTIGGYVRGQMKAVESNAAANHRAQLLIWACAPDGSTSRGTLLAMDTGSIVEEFDASTATNRRFPMAWLDQGATLSSTAVIEGDFLVVEWGLREENTASNARTATFTYSDTSGADLDWDDVLDTGADSPWIEFSQEIQMWAPPVDPEGSGLLVAERAWATTAELNAHVSVIAHEARIDEWWFTTQPPTPYEASSTMRTLTGAGR